MKILKQLLCILVLLCLSQISLAQTTVNIVSHYPDTAFITNRLLPFSVQANGDIDIQSVKIGQGGDGCIVFMDRYYKNTFHFYCDQVTQANAEVEYLLDSSTRLVSVTETINILGTSDPSGEPAPSSGPDSNSNTNFQKGGE